MILTSLALTLFASVSNLNQCAYANQIQGINEEAQTILLNSIEKVCDDEKPLSFDEQLEAFGYRYLRFAEENNLADQSVIDEISESMLINNDLYELAFEDELPVIDFDNSQYEMETFDLDEEFLLDIIMSENLTDHSDDYIYHSGFENNENNNDDDDGLLKPNIGDLSDLVYNPVLDNSIISNSGDLDKPHTMPEGPSSGTGNGGGFQPTTPSTNDEYENIKLVDVDENQVAYRLNPSIGKEHLFGIAASADACKFVYNLLTGFMLNQVRKQTEGAPTAFEVVIKSILATIETITPGTVAVAKAQLMSIFSPILAWFCSLFTTCGVPGIIFGTIIALVGISCLAVIVSMFICGMFGWSFAIGWRYRSFFFSKWTWYCGGYDSTFCE